MVIVGGDVLERPDSDAVYSAVVTIASSGAKPDRDWKTLNVLHRVSDNTDQFLSFSFSLPPVHDVINSVPPTGSQPGRGNGCWLQGCVIERTAQEYQVSLSFGGGKQIMYIYLWSVCRCGRLFYHNFGDCYRILVTCLVKTLHQIALLSTKVSQVLRYEK